MKVVALVQARMGSTRLPNKVMKMIQGTPMIELLLTRLSMAREIDEIVVATSVDPRNLPLVAHVKQLGYGCEQGSENDVLERFVNAAKAHQADVVVRITGDCPLVDPALVDEVIRGFKTAGVDYFSNINPPTFPDGLDIEVFTFKALKEAGQQTIEPYDREHVTPYLRAPGRFNTGSMQYIKDLSGLRWTVDELADFNVIERVFQHFAPSLDFSWTDVLDLQQQQPEIFNSSGWVKSE